MWPDVLRLAWRQQAAFSAEQAVAAGVSRSWISDQHRRGELRRRAPAVYVLADAPRTARQDLVVQVLAAGPRARATADSALAVWCPELEFPNRPVVTAPLTCGYRSRAVELRRSRDLDLAVPAIIDGIPVVGVARALLDASVGRTPDQVLKRIGACQRHLRLSAGALVQALHTHARPGRPGIAVFRKALQALTAEVPDSEFERLVIRDLKDAGVPEPRLHHVVRLPGERPIELDLDWPGVLLDVELDGGDHTARMLRARRDRERDRLLQDAGYFVARYVWEDYLASPTAMVEEIARFLSSRS